MALVVWALPVWAADITMNGPTIAPYVTAKYIPYEKPDLCSCVSYAKFLTGTPQNTYWGNAWQIKPTSKIPEIDGLVLTREGGGHIAYIKDIRDDKLYIVESNYVHCKISERVLSIYDPDIKGYLGRPI